MRIRRKLHIVHYDPNRAEGAHNYQTGLCGRITDTWETYNYMYRVDQLDYGKYCKLCLDKYEFDQLMEGIKERNQKGI